MVRTIGNSPHIKSINTAQVPVKQKLVRPTSSFRSTLAASVAPPRDATFLPPRQNSTTIRKDVEEPLPFVPPFVPTFRSVSVGGSKQGPLPANPYYFSSLETAKWIADKYGTGEVLQVPYGGTGGPFGASEMEYHIKLPNGHLVNAGILASYYDRNPESKFPGVADQLIRGVLQAA